MSSRVFSNDEEKNESWLRTNLSLVPSYNNPPVRKTPAEISRSSQNARVIPIKEEEDNRKRWFREHFDPLIPIKTHDGMTPAEKILRSQQKMNNEIEREKVSKKVKQILQQYNAPVPVNKMIKNVKNGIKKVKDYLSPQPRMKSLGSSPPLEYGGYNYRKYKYTNITKKPAKPKILAKKPAKPKILAKKPAKPKILAKKPAKEI